MREVASLCTGFLLSRFYLMLFNLNLYKLQEKINFFFDLSQFTQAHAADSGNTFTEGVQIHRDYCPSQFH